MNSATNGGSIKVFRHDKDEGYSVERATSGLNAATTLSTARTWERGYWNRVIRFWRAQIEFAKKRTLPDDVQ